jgi:leucyl aminopeptidase
MSRHALIEATDATGATLVVVPKNGYAAWLEAESAPVRRWLEGTRFRADVGAITWLPNDAGTPDRVLAIANSDPLPALGDLSWRLPEGRYRLEAPWRGHDRLLALIGWGLGAYRFTRYKAPERRPAELAVDRAALADVTATLDAIALVRDLVNTPAGDMLPTQLADAASALAAEFGARCTVTVGDDLIRHNHPTIHAVGRASADAPRLIDIVWGDPSAPKLTLVGKGVCFDTGGLDLKSSANMRLMKKDMGGAAYALGLARLVMANALPVRLRVLIPAVENAVSGNAFRPGDIIRTRKGTTVEIDNTDAEGRLVLCDALTIACEESPTTIVDFATLTGAARTALGTDVPALFCNDDALARDIEAAARRVADPVWRLPLHAPYRKMLDSRAADMANGSSSPYAGAIVAALFLQSFVTVGIPWAHFDVMAWNLTSQPGRPEGGEAMGLRAVYACLAERFGVREEG